MGAPRRTSLRACAGLPRSTRVRAGARVSHRPARLRFAVFTRPSTMSSPISIFSTSLRSRLPLPLRISASFSSTRFAYFFASGLLGAGAPGSRLVGGIARLQQRLLRHARFARSVRLDSICQYFSARGARTFEDRLFLLEELLLAIPAAPAGCAARALERGEPAPRGLRAPRAPPSPRARSAASCALVHSIGIVGIAIVPSPRADRRRRGRGPRGRPSSASRRRRIAALRQDRTGGRAGIDAEGRGTRRGGEEGGAWGPRWPASRSSGT
jgi:hypothetical protein